MPLSLRLQSTSRSFERLYRAHIGDVYRYAFAMTGNAADAEDIAQTVFMNAYRALERGERPEQPRHWLIAITHNVCRQRFRQSARRPTEVMYLEDVAETLVPSDDTPTAADIQRALGELALNQREALVMRELEGRSYADIAEILGVSVSAVETLLFRARRGLREPLEGTLSCSEAEAALSLQLDGCLDRAGAALLLSHLRACETCRLLARRQRAQRKTVKALAVVPLAPGLASLFGGGASGRRCRWRRGGHRHEGCGGDGLLRSSSAEEATPSPGMRRRAAIRLPAPAMSGTPVRQPRRRSLRRTRARFGRERPANRRGREVVEDRPDTRPSPSPAHPTARFTLRGRT